jgi:hypothetical protein
VCALKVSVTRDRTLGRKSTVLGNSDNEEYELLEGEEAEIEELNGMEEDEMAVAKVSGICYCFQRNSESDSLLSFALARL